MKRALATILVLLLCASGASAQMLLSGAGPSLPGCPAAGTPSPDGSTISPANTACALKDSGGDAWNFPGTTFAGGSNIIGTNFDLTFNGAAGTFWGTQAESVSGGQIYFQQNYTHCGNVWRHYNLATSEQEWATAPGTIVTSFRDTTASVNYAGLQELFDHVPNNHAVTISAAPAPFNCWPDQSGIGPSGLTITATGASFNDAQSSKGILVFNGSNITLNGGDYAGAIRISDGAANPTLQNVTVHDNCGLIVTSCILSGAGNGTVTLTNVTVYNGGDGSNPGQDHNVYISADVNTDTAATLLITNLYSHDVNHGGWTLKMRPECITTQCHITQSYIVCTSASSGVCEQNGVVDMPCGGNYLIDFSTLERGAGGDNGYVLRMLEEPVGPSNCAPRAATNNIVIDHDIVIWDGPSPGWAVTNLICIANHDGSGNCETSGVPAGTTCTISNSVIVSDSANSITLVNGAGCTEGANVRHYANRSAAGAAEGWAAFDRFGNPCCAFPYQPTHM